MILNAMDLLDAAPIKDMLSTKERANGASHGLAEAGYDIRLKQEVQFFPTVYSMAGALIRPPSVTIDGINTQGSCFTLASAMEEFQMPDHLMGIVHDKSTWARHGLSVFNTVIEPGWRGFLTLELVYHGHNRLIIPAGTGIAQVVFHCLTSKASYDGKYQDQEDGIVPPILA